MSAAIPIWPLNVHRRWELLEAIERDLARIQTAVTRQRNPLRGKAEIGIVMGTVVEKHSMRKHFKVAIDEATLRSRARRM